MPQITGPNQLPSVNSLRRVANRGGLYRFLEFQAFRDVAFHIDDFDGDTINLDRYAVANSGGTSAASFATNITSGAVSGTGAIQADTGTDDNGSCSMIGPLIYKGDNHCGMAIRFRSDVVTEMNIEVGFIDAVPAANASGVSDVDTPAAAATDIAVVQFDTDQTLTGLAFVTKGGTANQTVKATSLSGATPENTVWMTAVIQLIGNDAYAQIISESSTGGSAIATHNNRGVSANSAGFIEGGTAVAPWVYIRTRNATTARFVDVDYLALWTYRVAQ